MIKVLFADDHSIVRAGLRRIVEESGDIEVVAEAADGQEAIQKAHEAMPDVAVIDLSMPGMDGLEVISQLHVYYPKLPILILTMYEEEQYVVRAIAAGAMGYVTKRSAPEELVTAIHKVHAGRRYLSNSAAELLAQRVGKGMRDFSPLDSLLDQDFGIVLEGFSNSNLDLFLLRHLADAYAGTQVCRFDKKGESDILLNPREYFVGVLFPHGFAERKIFDNGQFFFLKEAFGYRLIHPY